jgi:hypothetical protein
MASNLREGGRQRIGMMGSEDEDDGHALEIEEVEGQNSGDGEEDDEGMRMMVGMSNSNSMDGTYDDQDQDQDQGDYEDEEESLGLEPGFMPQLVKKAHFGGRRNSFWKPDLEQVFLERIKSYACLYDHRDSNWKNKVHKEGVWAAIGKEIGVAGKFRKPYYIGFVKFHINGHGCCPSLLLQGRSADDTSNICGTNLCGIGGPGRLGILNS